MGERSPSNHKRVAKLAREIKRRLLEEIPEVQASADVVDGGSGLELNVELNGERLLKSLDIEFYEQEEALEGLVRAVRARVLGSGRLEG